MTKVQMCFEDLRPTAVETRLQGVSKFYDTVVLESNERWSMLGTNERPRFQFGDVIIREIDH